MALLPEANRDITCPFEQSMQTNGPQLITNRKTKMTQLTEASELLHAKQLVDQPVWIVKQRNGSPIGRSGYTAE